VVSRVTYESARYNLKMCLPRPRAFQILDCEKALKRLKFRLKFGSVMIMMFAPMMNDDTEL
jgi:hypothetical protein